MVIAIGALTVTFLVARDSDRKYALPKQACWNANAPAALEPLMPDGGELYEYAEPLEVLTTDAPERKKSTYCTYSVDDHDTISVVIQDAARMGNPKDPKEHIGARVKNMNDLPFPGAAAISDSTEGKPDDRGTAVKAITPCGANRAPYLEFWFHVTEYANPDAKAREAATVRLMKQTVSTVKKELNCPR
ncbi:hypothetical protein LHJ74_11145 [Streptomyces sp. N2-109]|uniref:DUF3558 domain-containing protein n=1 Tax=Streptomyces gossypii TaxID=2883101 RepID=A0ABT2JRD6_9ACTN|nr:hypothetical protein [Streptomyces gossypii]MCT2590459.1 hypothetical protein [Streptomyces gossypii]